MRIIYEKWFNKGNKCFSIINYKESWKGIYRPFFTFTTNGASRKNKQDTCLDVQIVIGFTVFNYVNFDFNKKTG